MRGEEASFHAPSDSSAAGIQMVYQDLALVEPQDITINLNIGREILRKGPLGWLGFVDHKAMRKRSEAELDRLGVRTAPDDPARWRCCPAASDRWWPWPAARSGSPARSNGVLLLDEPTAALGYEQTKQVESADPPDGGPGHRDRAGHPQPAALLGGGRPGRRPQPGPEGRRRPVQGCDRDHIVGWITGAKESMFPVPAAG